MKKLVFLKIVVLAVLCIACKSKIETVSGYYDYETECVSVDRNGIQTVKAWGIGLNEKEAILNARRRAVDDILFKGIRGGNSSCEIRPIILNPNKRRDNINYFNRFYAPKGLFEQYAGLPDENWLRRKLKTNKKNDGKLAYEIIIEVDVMGLREQMKRDNLIQ
ncbi:hypothetical protein [Mesohalobacter halotolerans]|uniref:Uncharacterized protein n=1 Tax=Mesohalobacter halotolerans TaxID=1883405 RepID=A0A4U5TU44_9FLAO|nr:hypothetical protein [Mesohalobacter halotolerans]MBS3738251.1 hypothetical protein [Psychroflexus sp.]TKS57431.1 hypothetical protein FCN74_03150 [Mesohalobacter halotolerans]